MISAARFSIFQRAACEFGLATAPAFGLAMPAACFGLIGAGETAIEVMPFEADQRLVLAIDDGIDLAAALDFSDRQEGSGI